MDVQCDQQYSLLRGDEAICLSTFQATGIKLKLLLCLFTGRHVVCNTPMVEGTGLAELCHVHDEVEAMRNSILACMGKPANGQALEDRARILEDRFSNRRNAERILKML